MSANNYFLAHHEGKEATGRILAIGTDGPYLSHFQVKGGRWGIRRYQNYDGSLTPLGREHYGVGPARGSGADEKKDGKTDIRIGKDVTEVGAIKKSGVNVTVNGKQLSGIRANIKQKIQEHSENRAKAAVEKAAAKEEKRKEEEAKKESERLAKETIAEAERKKQEELETDKEKAAREALKNYYREHPLQIYSARDILTPDEMKEVQNKIVMDRQLKDFRRDEIMRYVRTAKDVANTIDTVYTGADNLRKLYNLGAQTYNSLVADKDPNDDKNPVPTIRDGSNKFKIIPGPSDKKSGDQNNKGNKNGGEQQNNSGSEEPKENTGKKSDKKAKQQSDKNNESANLKKEMVDKERSSSSNEKTEKIKNKFSDLKADVESGNKSKNKSEYVDKVELRNGETRYFYTEEAVKAYKDNKQFAEKCKSVYSKASDRERLKFVSDLDDIVDRRVKANTWTETDHGKYMAIFDAIYGANDEIKHADIEDDGLIGLDEFLANIGG